MCSLDVLFLHGMKFSSQTWFDKPMQSLQILSKLGYNAVAIDLPGNLALFNQRVHKKSRTDSIVVILFGLALFAKIILEALTHQKSLYSLEFNGRQIHVHVYSLKVC